jgi:hypothetical protein
MTKEKSGNEAEGKKKLGDKFEVILVFGDDGRLADVQPGTGTKDYKREEIYELNLKNIFSESALLYGHGSPGYTIYHTTSGYIKIEKPQ